VRDVTSEMIDFPLYIDGARVATARPVEVKSPYDGRLVGRTFDADADDVERAVRGVVRGFGSMRRLPSYERARVLKNMSGLLNERREQFARIMALEAGKPVRDARVEVDRAVITMETAAGEATRLYGEQIPLDVMAASADRMGITKRVPLGPVLGITPFNFPLNLVCHKLGPAIAAGDSILIKPAPKTPLTALMLADVALEAGLPADGMAVVLCSNEAAQSLVSDDRFKALSFTGSDVVGWRLKGRAGKKRVLLELGGNAGVIVDESADIELAATRIAAGGFSYAGQSCISVQRIYVHHKVFAPFAELLVTKARSLRAGDPLDEDTDIGHMISVESAERVEAWVKEAAALGATVLTGGNRTGNVYEPTVLRDVPIGAHVCVDEVFAPVVSLFPSQEFDDAVDALNDSRFGLQAGIFTRYLSHAMSAFAKLDVGGVIVNDISSFRADPMPYGGVKDSGLGREGLRYAIEELTELKLLVLRTGDLA
jgi:acyl-CoA reductase-like NAD-dependent aldehyde dehydrogenase